MNFLNSPNCITFWKPVWKAATSPDRSGCSLAAATGCSSWFKFVDSGDQDVLSLINPPVQTRQVLLFETEKTFRISHCNKGVNHMSYPITLSRENQNLLLIPTAIAWGYIDPWACAWKKRWWHLVGTEFLLNFESRKNLFSDSYKKNITGRTGLVQDSCVQCTILIFNFQLKEFKFSSNVHELQRLIQPHSAMCPYDSMM